MPLTSILFQLIGLPVEVETPLIHIVIKLNRKHYLILRRMALGGNSCSIPTNVADWCAYYFPVAMIIYQNSSLAQLRFLLLKNTIKCSPSLCSVNVSSNNFINFCPPVVPMFVNAGAKRRHKTGTWFINRTSASIQFDKRKNKIFSLFKDSFVLHNDNYFQTLNHKPRPGVLHLS